MTRGINKVILVGRLGSDPDVRFAPDGTAVVRFNIATNEPVRSSEGTWEERTEWHRIVVFGKQADLCKNYLTKGRLVYIEGRLRTRQWEDNQGVKRFTTEIVARDVQFLDSVGGGQRDLIPPSELISDRRSQVNSVLPEDLPGVPPPDVDDDIPF